jgi:hypothetical protein
MSKHYTEVIDILSVKSSSNDFLGIATHKDVLRILSHGKSSAIEILEFSDIARIVKVKSEIVTIIVSNNAIYCFKVNEYFKPKVYLIHQLMGLVVSESSNQLLLKFLRDEDRSEDVLLIELVKRAEFIDSLLKVYQLSSPDKEFYVLLVVN